MREGNCEGKMGWEKDRVEGGMLRAFGKAQLRVELIIFLRTGYLQVPGCVRLTAEKHDASEKYRNPERIAELIPENSVQVNIPAESGEMGILANHVPAIEQLKPGLVEIIEEAGASKQFFRTSHPSIGESRGGIEGYWDKTTDMGLIWHMNSFRRFRHRPARLQAQHQRC